MPHYVIFYTLFIAGVSYALWKGGTPERIAAGVLLGGVALTLITQMYDAHRYATVQWGVAMVDAGVLAGFLATALLSTRYWPMWLTAFQLIQLCSDFAKLLPGVADLTYAMASSLLVYPLILTLVVATSRHRMRTAQYGSQPAWRHQLTD